jgi:hypothetical protein
MEPFARTIDAAKKYVVSSTLSRDGSHSFDTTAGADVAVLHLVCEFAPPHNSFMPRRFAAWLGSQVRRAWN